MKPSKLFHRVVLPFVFVGVVILMLIGDLVMAQSRWAEDFSEYDEDNYFIRGNPYCEEDDEYFVLTRSEGSQHGRIYNLQEFPMAIFTVEFDIPT